MAKFSNCLINNSQPEYLKCKSIMIESATEVSFNKQMYDFLIENGQEFNNAKKSLYTSMNESTSYVTLNEGFNDFFSKVKKIIDKFIAFIKSLFDRFIMAMKKMFGSKDYIKQKKDQLYKFTDDDRFTYNGFMYTFQPDIPYIDALAQFNVNFVDLGSDKDQALTDLKIDSTDDKYTQVATAIADKRAKLTADLNGDYYDLLRGQILGTQGEKIYDSDWAERLFEQFRNGDTAQTKFDIDKSTLMEALISFETFDKRLSEAKKLKDKIEKDYKDIKNSLENMIKKSKNGDKLSYTIDDRYDGLKGELVADSKIMAQIDMFIKLKVEQVEMMSNIHGTAFSAKLTALNDSMKQNTDVLYKALGVVAKKKK